MGRLPQDWISCSDTSESVSINEGGGRSLATSERATSSHWVELEATESRHVKEESVDG